MISGIGRVYTEKELAAMWGLKPNTLQKWRCRGVGPNYVKRVGRIFYREIDLYEYETRQEVRTDTNKRRCL